MLTVYRKCNVFVIPFAVFLWEARLESAFTNAFAFVNGYNSSFVKIWS